ncbi:hypothetical protein WJ978_18250 [Achromobacter xylosoxidans]
MAKTLTQVCNMLIEYPSTERAARVAAREWFQSTTRLTAAQFRDMKLSEHSSRHDDAAVEYLVRQDTFRRAFAAEVGKILVDEGRLNANTP